MVVTEAAKLAGKAVVDVSRRVYDVGTREIIGVSLPDVGPFKDMRLRVTPFLLGGIGLVAGTAWEYTQHFNNNRPAYRLLNGLIMYYHAREALTASAAPLKARIKAIMTDLRTTPIQKQALLVPLLEPIQRMDEAWKALDVRYQGWRVKIEEDLGYSIAGVCPNVYSITRGTIGRIKKILRPPTPAAMLGKFVRDTAATIKTGIFPALPGTAKLESV